MAYQRYLSDVAKLQASQAPSPANPTEKPDDVHFDMQAELQRAEDRLSWAEKMHEKGYVSDSQLATERLNVESLKVRQAEDHHLQELLRPVRARALDLHRAKDRLEWAEQMLKKGYVAKSQVERERLNRSRAEHLYKDLVEGRDAVTLKGVVRDKATQRPLAGIQVSGGVEGGTESVTTKSDADGRFELPGLPVSQRYTMVVGCVSGEPYLLTSRVVEMKKGEPHPSADIELVRGIPFRVRILDAATGKPIRGGISYFPLYPNNPIARGVLGYTAGGGWVAGAFYETSLNGEGDYRGAVLPGKGVLCFQPAGGKWEWKKGERELALFSPDGTDIIKLEGTDGPGPMVFGNPLSNSNPPAWGGLGLIHYPAVIAINPKEETKEIDYEFKIPNPDLPTRP